MIKIRDLLPESYIKLNEIKKWKDYTIPSDKNLLLYDFYTLSYLSTTSFSDIDIAKQKGSFIGRTEDELKRNILEFQKKLFPYLKEELLNAVFFSIACEVRHVKTQSNLRDGSIQTNINSFTDKALKVYLNLLNKNFEKYKKEFETNYPDTDDKDVDRNANIRVVNNLIEKLNWSRDSFIIFAKNIFSKLKWNSKFGGRSWEKICNAWLELNATEKNDYTKLQIYIDHIYDIQHNTGTVLNKVKEYYRDGYDWILDALDFKANIKNPRQLLEKCSTQMKYLALEVFKIIGIPRHRGYVEELNDKVKNGRLSNVYLKDYVSKTQLKKLPDKLKIITNDLYANGSALTDLNNLEKVGNDMHIEKCLIKKLPDNFKSVGESLYATQSQLEDLNNLEKVGYSMNISNTSVKKLPDKLKYIGANLSASNSKLENLNNLKEIAYHLYIENTPIKKLPDGLKIGQSLHANFSKLETLDNLTIEEDVYIKNTKIEKIPDSLTLGEDSKIYTNNPYLQYSDKFKNKIVNDAS